jgi:acyl dehydratase
MATAICSLTAREVMVGARLPELRVRVTATTIVMGASASRDWQPQHHDHQWATERAGTRDIFLNTPAQAGWISRFITDWTGPGGRIGRISFRMKNSICPGDTMVLSGTVKAVSDQSQEVCWVELQIEIKSDQTVCTLCRAVVALPAGDEDSPWQKRGTQWQVPALGPE